MLVVVEAEELDDIPGAVFWLRKSPIPCHVMYIEFSLGLAQAHLPASGTGPGRWRALIVTGLNAIGLNNYG